mmetsp:Transcript_3876/g.8667  ORF Transcript_3876/g.8667 Transcript_3876/m.8667 type:complete len:652 (-) Transcript_3876:141-2096(-)
MSSGDDSYADDSVLGEGNHDNSNNTFNPCRNSVVSSLDVDSESSPTNNYEDTEQDEAIAQALQEEFRREVEQYAQRRSEASRNAWLDIHSLFTPSSSSNTINQGNVQSNRMSVSSSSNGNENNIPSSNTSSSRYTANYSKSAYKAQTNTTPDTSLTESSSPDISFEYEDSRTIDLDAAFDTYTGPYDNSSYILDDLQRTHSQTSRHNQGHVMSDSIYLDDVSRDEALARRLEQEMRDEELATNLANLNSASAGFALEEGPRPPNGIIVGRDPRSNANHARSTVRGVPGNLHSLDSLHSAGSDGFVDSPSSVQHASRHRSRTQPSSHQQPPQSRTPLCQTKLCHYSLRLLLAAVVAALSFLIFLMVFGPKSNNDSLDPSSWLPGWPDSDPNLGSVGENNVWDMRGEYRGLTLQVLNNLDAESHWNEFFEAAVSDWDNGDPDAVTLYVRQGGDYDPECRAIRRAMKVCNGNYGPTDWRGVNQILLQDEYIITSLAKMNDYYLEGTTKAQKQYTMCHELGHGLGLGHTDENFHNRDLGNCMDYTERPQNNMHPDESNFETLVGLYGNVDGTSVRVAKDALPPDNQRKLKEERTLVEFEYYAGFLAESIEVAGRETLEHPGSKRGWRMLHQNESAEVHERNLGNGYTIRTTVLLA